MCVSGENYRQTQSYMECVTLSAWRGRRRTRFEGSDISRQVWRMSWAVSEVAAVIGSSSCLLWEILILFCFAHASSLFLSLSLANTHTFYKNTQGQSSLLIEVLSTGSGEMGPSVQLTIFAALSTYDPSHCQLHLTGTINQASQPHYFQWDFTIMVPSC